MNPTCPSSNLTVTNEHIAALIFISVPIYHLLTPPSLPSPHTKTLGQAQVSDHFILSGMFTHRCVKEKTTGP